jgi:threonine synthase
MWRYRCVLPDVRPVTLGEGWTPMLPSPSAFRKEEGANPTGSFKARGLGLGRHHGASLWRARACRTAGGQRGRRARGIGGRHQRTHFHAARCSLRQLRRGGSLRCEPHSGQRSYFGLFRIAGESWPSAARAKACLTSPRLKTPFRVEGKRTMGYELIEQPGWEYPDAVFYPTRGGSPLQNWRNLAGFGPEND